MKITIANSYRGPGIGLTNSRILVRRKYGGPGFWKRLPTVNGIHLSTRETIIFIELWKPQSRKKALIVDYRKKALA